MMPPRRVQPISRTTLANDKTATKQHTVRAEVAKEREKNTLVNDALQARKRRVYRQQHPEARVMLDADLDELIAKQDPASQKQQTLSQGMSEEEHKKARQSGQRVTQEDREQAQKLADLHNNSFFGGMVAPPVSAEFAAQNPEYMQSLMSQNATYLPNAFFMGSGFDLPSATGAAVNGVRQGWQTAGNFANRAWNATTQGVRAAVPVVTNPRYAATTGAFLVPAAAEAANGERSATGVLSELFALSTAGTLAGLGGKRLYKFGKNKMFPERGPEPKVVLKPTTMVKKEPKKVKYPEERAYKKPLPPAASATEAEKEAYNKTIENFQKTKEFEDYLIKLRQFRETKNYNDYIKAKEAWDKVPESAQKWRSRGKWWALPTFLGTSAAAAGLSDLVGGWYKDLFPNSIFKYFWNEDTSKSENNDEQKTQKETIESNESLPVITPEEQAAIDSIINKQKEIESLLLNVNQNSE